MDGMEYDPGAQIKFRDYGYIAAIGTINTEYSQGFSLTDSHSLPLEANADSGFTKL